MNTRDHPCIYELWKYFLEQSKSFVLHQNQVSSCKGYGYWFKKFKDFPSQSSDGAPSFWSLFVATFRPTLDSTFNIITTRLEPVRLEPSAPSHISSSWWPHDVDSVLSICCLYRRYRPAADRRQHVACAALRCSKASLNLRSPLASAVAAVCNQLERRTLGAGAQSQAPSPQILVLCSLAWKSNQQWSHCCSENLGITKIRKVSLHLAEELISISWSVGSN